MILDGVEFHNVAETRKVEGRPGVRLQRVPEDVRMCLNEGAQNRMLSPAGSEIRFVSERDTVRITLSYPEGSSEMFPFFGPFQASPRVDLGPEPKTIEMTYPARLKTIDPEAEKGMAFSPRVWRFIMRGNSMHYYGIEGKGLRPPTAEEVPKLRYLSYGTSITHGSAATAMHLTYVSQVAWRIGADLINLGVGGSAYCEHELADYIAGRDDWDVATLALSVNMVGKGFSEEEFEERVTYMVNTVAASNTDRQVVCITIYPHSRDFCTVDDAGKERSQAFRRILREVVTSCPHPNVQLLEGPDMLEDIGGLTVVRDPPSGGCTNSRGFHPWLFTVAPFGALRLVSR